MTRAYDARLPGYAQWSSWLTSDPDGEGLVFREFQSLSTLNILYIQSEMMEIESRWTAINNEAVKNLNIESIGEMRNWKTLVEHCQKDHPRYMVARERMDLLRELRAKIKEYHEALLLKSRIAQFRRPERRVFGALRHMMKQGNVPKIDGIAKRYLDDEDDLLALVAPGHEDYLSQCLRKRLAFQDKNQDPELGLPEIARFRESTITTIVNLITVLVAAVFLVGPIVTLYLVQTAWVKLTLVAIFTVGFAASVVVITRARRAEIFVGTAT